LLYECTCLCHLLRNLCGFLNKIKYILSLVLLDAHIQSGPLKKSTLFHIVQDIVMNVMIISFNKLLKHIFFFNNLVIFCFYVSSFIHPYINYNLLSSVVIL
jgi:hypothetical protein